MKRRTLATLLLLGIVICGLGAAAAPQLVGGNDAARPFRTFVRGQIGRLLTLQSELDVTAEQLERIREIVHGHRAEICEVAQPIVEKRCALCDAVLAESPEEAAIRSAASDLGQAVGDAAVLASKVKGETDKVLTSEQRKKIDAFRQQSDAAVDQFVEKLAKQL